MRGNRGCWREGLASVLENRAKQETAEVRLHKKEQILQTPGIQTAAVSANER